MAQHLELTKIDVPQLDATTRHLDRSNFKKDGLTADRPPEI
jgi:hypothetical protein